MLLLNRAEVKKAFADMPVGVNVGLHSKKKGVRELIPKRHR